jgi:diguanylate cyclase (GGDEF)-like protein
MKQIYAMLALLAGLFLVPAAVAGDLIVSRAQLEDPTGKLTIAYVAGRVVAPAGDSLAIPSTRTVHWLCLRVRQPASGSKVVLFIRPSHLNEVRLYEAGPGDPLTWKTRVTGNRYPYRDRDRASVALGFVVDVNAPEATYYLRVNTRSSATFIVEALEPAEAVRQDQQRDLVMVFFVTAMLCLLFWAILSYLLDHKPVVGLFAIHQAAYTLFGMVTTGYLAPLVPARFPQLVDSANIVLYCAIGFTPLLFCRALFKPYDPPPALMRGLNLMMCAFPVLLAAIALGYDIEAVNANLVLIRIEWLYFAVVAFSLRTELAPRRRLLQIFFVSILLNNGIFWYAGRIPRIASVVSLTALRLLIVDGLVIGGLFAIILHTRARQAWREAQQAALDLVLVQKKLELEEELKKQAELQAQTDFLTGLFNRRHFVELAERELARSVRFQRPLTLLMIDVDNFKTINDTWGHATGDFVLQQLSHLIRDILRNVDIFGRVGGEEFAAVVVETEGDDAIVIAQRLCAMVADAAILPSDDRHNPVTVSIGVAQLNHRSLSLSSLLDEADRAMYAAKQEGRNGFVVFEDRCL